MDPEVGNVQIHNRPEKNYYYVASYDKKVSYLQIISIVSSGVDRRLTRIEGGAGV